MFILNEVSINSQFIDADEFNVQIYILLQARSTNDILRERLKVSNAITNRKINSNLTVYQAIVSEPNPDRRKLILTWLTSSGPFHDDDRFAEEDDYFEFEKIDVTDTGLGEAARRKKSGIPVTTVSFQGGDWNFERTPLAIDHGMLEDRLGCYLVDNIWSIEELLRESKQTRPTPKTWLEFVTYAQKDYPFLRLPNSIYENPALKRQPFNRTMAEATNRLLDILNRYVEIANEYGRNSEDANNFVTDYFSGKRALFSPESRGNINDFRKQMTFSDPEDPSKEIFANWHGKISHRVFRLHFEWPIPAGQNFIKVLYIGPKITKT